MNKTPAYRGYINRIDPLGNNYDNKLVAILYFTSIAGRDDDGVQYEWKKGPLSIETAKLHVTNYIRVMYTAPPFMGNTATFGIIFPTCARIFAWSWISGSKESNLFEYFSFHPDSIVLVEPKKPIPAANFIGCGLENLIIAEETKLWYGAETVEEYYSLPRNPDLKIELKKRDKLGCKPDHKPN